ncbi:MAG: cation:dicarboxylase symporter family transporter, partial [Desulfobacterales bacterium]|nr:cation:dicarboxylase symporter family transporter [Desulfobacterales bacterium]
LSSRQAKALARKAGVLLLLFWALGFFIILVLPLAFPQIESGSFFSTSLVAPPREVDFVDLYIPANPFESMANNIVPAVVLFSLFVGIALMGAKNKDIIIKPLSTLSDALIKVANYVVYLTPIGVFAISASAAGTMTVAEFGRLQAYFITFTIGTVVLTFWILPLMVAAFTPFKYKDIVGISKDALITGFTTGNLFIILPVLIQNCKRLFEQYRLEHPDIDSSIDIIVPVSFNFPNLGKLLMLLFILFAGWFYGVSVSLLDYPNFIFSGLFSFFGSVDVAIPFMLDLLRIPADAFQLYLVTGVVNGRLATLLAAMNLVAFTLIATCSITGLMAINWRKIMIYSLVSVVLTLGLTLGSRVYLAASLQTIAQTEDEAITRMKLKTTPQPMIVHKSIPPERAALEPGLTRLGSIRQRGVIRVGYHKDNLPFTFFNRYGDLVGLDIDLAHSLAEDLGVRIEFIPFDFATLTKQLAENHFDIAMSGIVILAGSLRHMTFTDSYMETNWAFVVRDHLRSKFASLESIKDKEGLTIGITTTDATALDVERYFSNAKAVRLNAVSEFFIPDQQNADCLAISAEAGSAWTLLYPEYQVVVPTPMIGTQLIGIPVAGADQDLLTFLNTWIELTVKTRFSEELFDHWILGRGAEDKQPRWSIMKDVLGWVD